MRALSLRQAARCETAKTPHCKCRCHGALHGVFRDAALKNTEATVPELLAFFQALPADDPHHLDDAETKKRKRRERRKKAAPTLSREKSPNPAISQISQGVKKPRKIVIETTFQQLPLIPRGLEQEMLGVCAQCGQDEWIHRAYWAATVGADHEFQPKEAS